MKESKLWSLHIFSGAILLFLLGLHMVIMHFDKILNLGDSLAWNSVLSRMQSTGHTIIYLLLLLFAVYHGLYGVRSLIFELNLSKKGRSVVSFIIVVVGLVALVYGAYSIIAGHMAKFS